MSKFVDIEKLIEEKNPKLAKWLPGFVVRYLKRTIHEDETNAFMEKTQDYDTYEFVAEIIDYLNIKVNIQGLENIPEKDGAILVANHPLGGMDAISILHEIKHIRTDVKFIVNDLLLHLRNLKSIFVGVNKHGTNSKDSLRAVDELFATNNLVFLFPAGLVSRRNKGEIKDLEWKKTFVSRAKKYEKNVIPVYIEGSLGNFFYRLSNFRSRVGIKANIEMLYLVDELYKQRNKTIDIIIGEPIPASTYDKTKRDIEWAAWTKEKVYALKNK
ncbi:MAG: 1-acyl-sn-glycerol-3-phosphate acyltransferase [Crocinitomicaceae bacterium]|nr:1-acyl-sn-glycerol-3-phosphate acyltransferase [Crocinitomicaceae bacterium]